MQGAALRQGLPGTCGTDHCQIYFPDTPRTQPPEKPEAKGTTKGNLKPRIPCLTLPQRERTPGLNRGLEEATTTFLPGRRPRACPPQISFHHWRQAEPHCIWDLCLLLGKKAEKHFWPLYKHQLCSLFTKQLFA